MRKKTCSHCKELLPGYAFNQNRQAADGLAAKCKQCVKETRELSELEAIRSRTDSSKSSWFYKSRLSPPKRKESK